jgi:glycosyltransferase involved in cell wall biosynthesis
MDLFAEKTSKWNLDVSIIIPVKDEEQNISSLAEEIDRIMEATSWSWECLWVDDGSTDQTAASLERLATRDARHQFLVLSRSYGQSAALYAGFSQAHGKILVTMDGDGQNDPSDIPVLVSHLLSNDLDAVNGWREIRRDSFVRKASSSIANAFRNWLTKDQVKDVGCSMRAFRHSCVERVPLFKGVHRFLPTLLRIAGYHRIVEIPVKHRPRKHGYTKYGIHNRLWVGIVDCLAVRWMKARAVNPIIRTSSLKERDQ